MRHTDEDTHYTQGLEEGGEGVTRIPAPFLQESRISLSFHIDIPYPVPNFGESRLPGAAKFRIPNRF